MKITTNPIGNYSINSVRKVQNTPQAQKVEKSENNILSKDEKAFFAEKYPTSKNEIMKYHFYNSNGKFGGVAVGNNIDRRG
ncbi:MAG: hypothetical protein D6830_00745 [Ignavibacteria bacterium]|nr:MAG: hypothetical protein D6830_00745 [Ignavibacteria bacterium]